MLLFDTVYEPLRRWGQKTGVLCVWAIGEDGRKVLLSPRRNSESCESCREVLRDLVKRGLRPGTITTDGATGLTQAIDAVWPKSLRIRCWFIKCKTSNKKCRPSLVGGESLASRYARCPETGEGGERRTPRGTLRTASFLNCVAVY